MNSDSNPTTTCAPQLNAIRLLQNNNDTVEAVNAPPVFPNVPVLDRFDRFVNESNTSLVSLQSHVLEVKHCDCQKGAAKYVSCNHFQDVPGSQKMVSKWVIIPIYHVYK